MHPSSANPDAKLAWRGYRTVLDFVAMRRRSDQSRGLGVARALHRCSVPVDADPANPPSVAVHLLETGQWAFRQMGCLCGVESWTRLVLCESRNYEISQGFKASSTGWEHTSWVDAVGIPPLDSPWFDRFGFALQSRAFHMGRPAPGAVRPTVNEYLMTLPHWFIALLFAILPAWRFAATRRKPDSSSCPQCGYDLRATPERCPECGTAFTTPASAT